jgi:hypothetical protein
MSAWLSSLSGTRRTASNRQVPSVSAKAHLRVGRQSRPELQIHAHPLGHQPRGWLDAHDAIVVIDGHQSPTNVDRRCLEDLPATQQRELARAAANVNVQYRPHRLAREG